MSISLCLCLCFGRVHLSFSPCVISSSVMSSRDPSSPVSPFDVNPMLTASSGRNPYGDLDKQRAGKTGGGCLQKRWVKVVLVCTPLLLLLLLLLLLRKSSDSSPAPPAVVRTSLGLVQGAWVEVAPAGGSSLTDLSAAPSSTRVAAFRSMPYAASPVRWTAPQPAPAWTGVYDATEFRSACVQPDSTGSEDCLYLNVFVPEAVTTRMATVTRGVPVIMYIHGGCLMSGTGNNEPWHHFAAHAGTDSEGAIAVTINYRLNMFGE
jgi:hypothetical protein